MAMTDQEAIDNAERGPEQLPDGRVRKLCGCGCGAFVVGQQIGRFILRDPQSEPDTTWTLPSGRRLCMLPPHHFAYYVDHWPTGTAVCVYNRAASAALVADSLSAFSIADPASPEINDVKKQVGADLLDWTDAVAEADAQGIEPPTYRDWKQLRHSSTVRKS